MTLPSPSYTLIVDPPSQGARLDKFLASALKDFSRTRLSDLIQEGYVTITGEPAKDPAFKVKEGHVITITIPPSIEALPLPRISPLILSMKTRT